MTKHSLFLFAAAVLILGSACTRSARIPIPGRPAMTKLAQPVILQDDSTVILLSDYVGMNPVDSIQVSQALTTHFSPESPILILQPNGTEIPAISTLRLWVNGWAYDLVLTRSPEATVRITYDPGNRPCRQVEMASQINDWTPSKTPLHLNNGIWETELKLFPGNYQYQLAVDGKWMLDPANPDSASNGIGGYNSVLHAGNLDSLFIRGIFADASEQGKVVIGGITPETDHIVLWQNYRVPESMISFDQRGMVVSIPENALQMKRSFLRVWASLDGAASNDVLIPLERGRVITNTGELTRTDRETMILYFMMVDRFANGNQDNDQPVEDPEVDPRVNFMGGDLDGILSKLKENYFTDLGVNTLWISPIIRNPDSAYHEYPPPHRKFSGYHGYWPLSFTSIDPRFGSPAVLKELVTESHRKDINVILDFVAHHVHQNYPLLDKHPDWITQVDLPDGRKNIRIWDEQRLTTWFDIFLPTLNLAKPEVYEFVSDSAAWWISEYRLDGFRHDAAKHVPEIFWRTLTHKIDSILGHDSRNFYQIGETFGSRKLIKSYINPGMLDAQFDFNLYWDVRNAFAFDSSTFLDLNSALLQSLAFFGSHHLMGNITGNQDMARFISYADGSLDPGEDDREAGWAKEITVTNPVAYRRLASMMAFNMTIPGIPVIYYGDEFGLPGANDPDNRRMMKFDGLLPEEGTTLGLTKMLTRIRSHHMALLYGDFKPILVTRDQYVYLRSYMNDAVVVAFNKSAESVRLKVTIPYPWQDQPFRSRSGETLQMEPGEYILSLPPVSFEIYSNN